MKEFSDLIERAGLRVGRSNAFCDFLTFAVCALSMQQQEEQYLTVAKRYEPKEMNLFSQAFGVMVNDMDNRGEGLKDCLGDYFMEIMSSERKGQFFTPEPICDLISKLCNEFDAGKTVSDPACGSGRFFLSAAKINRRLMYWGCDIDLQCCQMTIINMCLNGLRGVVSHMDTLKGTEWRRWAVEIHPIYRIPYVREIDLSQGFETIPRSEFEFVEMVKEEPKQLQLFIESVDSLRKLPPVKPKEKQTNKVLADIDDWL